MCNGFNWIQRATCGPNCDEYPAFGTLLFDGFCGQCTMDTIYATCNPSCVGTGG